MSCAERQVLEDLADQFPERDIRGGNLSVLHRGKFANAVVYRFRHEELDCVIKDFSHCPLPFRATLGRLFIRREAKALQRLQDLEGIASCHRKIGRYALLYPFVEGDSLKDIARSGKPLPRDFFSQLEKLVMQMHQRGVAHLDMRNMGNVLRTRDGRPHLIDFQSALSMKYFPKRLRASMRGADLSGVYKSWARIGEQPLPRIKQVFFDNFGSLRKLWPFKGYPQLSSGGRCIKVMSSGLAVGYLVCTYLLMR